MPSPRPQRTLLHATAIVNEIKRELRTVGITLRCSVGLAPNRLLAKIAGDMQKPDGLMIFERRYLPQALYSLEVTNIPGIGNRMSSAFLTKAYHHASQLCSLTLERMHTIWGGVLGIDCGFGYAVRIFLNRQHVRYKRSAVSTSCLQGAEHPIRPVPWRSNCCTRRPARCAVTVSGPEESPYRSGSTTEPHSPAMYASDHATIHSPCRST
jgi:hypothetical protein